VLRDGVARDVLDVVALVAVLGELDVLAQKLLVAEQPGEPQGVHLVAGVVYVVFALHVEPGGGQKRGDRVEELTDRNGAIATDEAVAGESAGGGDDRLIEELEIGVRAYNCLKRAGVQTIGDLQAKSESELKAIPNFGERSIEEVIEAMHGLGLDLRAE